MATKISPPFPYNVENAYWLNSAPVFPVGIDFVVNITSAVRFNTINVSINTPVIATNPCSTGWSTFATACACGVDPIPASLENNPLATPFVRASFTVAPAAPPTTELGENAPIKIDANA